MFFKDIRVLSPKAVISNWFFFYYYLPFFLAAGPLLEILSYKKPEHGAVLVRGKASSQTCLGGHRAQDQLRSSSGE